MGAHVLRCGAEVAALVMFLSLTEPGWLPAADVEADFVTTTEGVVGKDRIVLLSVTRFTEFVASEGKGPRAVASLRVMYLREWLGEQSKALTASEVEVFAAGTTDKPFRFAGKSHTTVHSSKNYVGYTDWLKRQDDEWLGAKLPAVQDANLATVSWVTVRDVQVTAKKADVRVKVGEGVVVFKNIPLE